MLAPAFHCTHTLTAMLLPPFVIFGANRASSRPGLYATMQDGFDDAGLDSVQTCGKARASVSQHRCVQCSDIVLS